MLEFYGNVITSTKGTTFRMMPMIVSGGITPVAASIRSSLWESSPYGFRSAPQWMMALTQLGSCYLDAELTVSGALAALAHSGSTSGRGMTG